MAAGFEDVETFEHYSYDDALVGITECGRAVYDYDKMVEWLMDEEGRSREDAIAWIDYNTVRALSYGGSGAPVIMRSLITEE